MLLSYHLFLSWLLLKAKEKAEIIRPIGYSASIHLACQVAIDGNTKQIKS